MEIKPLPQRQQTLIVNNVVRACEDIEKLNKTGYKYINLCAGFIAHYNLYGFRDAYSDGSLRSDILKHQHQNQWNNFRPGEKNYDYYKSRAQVYNQIVEKLLDTA